LAGITLNFITTDPNLTHAFLCEKYGLMGSAVRVVPSRLSEGVLGELEKEETVAIVTITKDVSAFLRAQSATIKIRNSLYIGLMLIAASWVIGAVMLGFMISIGSFTIASPLALLAVQLIWSLPFMLIVHIYKLLA
jgi:hypothetical protein